MSGVDFSPAWLESLRERMPLSAWIGRRVRLTQRGEEATGLCPFHQEKSPSFTVNDRKQFFHCFGCGAHGDLFAFIERDQGLGFRESVMLAASEAGMPLPTSATPAADGMDKKRREGLALLESLGAWFRQQLTTETGHRAREYLAQRGVPEETVERFGIGYAPANLDGWLRRQGSVSPAMLYETGIMVEREDRKTGYPKLRERLVFPIHDAQGRIVAFGGRLLSSEQRGPKYLHFGETQWFHKGQLIYGYHLARPAIARGAPCIVTEGYMDTIMLHAHGYEGAVAGLGTAFTLKQLERLWQVASNPCIAMDGDAAGQRASWHLCEIALPLIHASRQLRFLTLPPEHDPDSFLRRYGRSAFDDALAKASRVSTYLWQHCEAKYPEDGTPETTLLRRAWWQEHSQRIQDPEVRQAFQAEGNKRLMPAVWEPRQPRQAGAGASWRPSRKKVGEPLAGVGLAVALHRPHGGDKAYGWQQDRLGLHLLALGLAHPGLFLEEWRHELLCGWHFSEKTLDKLVLDVVSSLPAFDDATTMQAWEPRWRAALRGAGLEPVCDLLREGPTDGPSRESPFAWIATMLSWPDLKAVRTLSQARDGWDLYHFQSMVLRLEQEYKDACMQQPLPIEKMTLLRHEMVQLSEKIRALRGKMQDDEMT